MKQHKLTAIKFCELYQNKAVIINNVYQKLEYTSNNEYVALVIVECIDTKTNERVEFVIGLDAKG